MKTHHTLDCVEEIDFSVFAINSHSKPYTLCWNINKTLELNFEKVQNQLINNNQEFSRYKSFSNHGAEYNIIVNRSKKGYLIPDQKRVNYFLILNNKLATKSTEDIISQLKQIKEVLFVFKIDEKQTKYIDRFIFNDKKN
jgi:hypothetical protein|tara:strand:+ start:283 stop:702 length:420 start_codon:yes stop_codon:yes gene_type:complete